MSDGIIPIACFEENVCQVIPYLLIPGIQSNGLVVVLNRFIKIAEFIQGIAGYSMGHMNG